MVSKVAVIALVAIISVPILLGYAMNLNEETITEFKGTGNAVNVTQLLQTGTQYKYVNADTDSLNTHFKQGSAQVLNKVDVEPQYSITTVRGSTPIYQYRYTAGNFDSAMTQTATFDYYYQQSDYSGSGGVMNLTLYNSSNVVMKTYTDVHSYRWNKSDLTMSVVYYDFNHTLLIGEVWDLTLTDKFQASVTAGYNSTGFIQLSDNVTYSYADFSQGYRIRGIPSGANEVANSVYVNLPQYSRNMMMSVNLDTISDNSYTFKIIVGDTGNWSSFSLVKTTDGSGVHWSLYKGSDLVSNLYYDSSRTSNTYQILISTEGVEARYVGNWPTVIGAANYYQTYSFNWDSYTYDSLINVLIASNSPKFRIDSAEYRGLETPIIENMTYKPADFKNNPSTKLDNIYSYGTSIVFGGNTYTVKDGNITMGTHKIPINGMVFDSVPDSNGDYDNRINGTVVSTTHTPSTITLNGQWSASVTTEELQPVTRTVTEWQAGSFGWDGIDHNFLIVGLITSFGAFIALGIYMRRTKASLWPLLIVCGGAAVLFFVML